MKLKDVQNEFRLLLIHHQIIVSKGIEHNWNAPYPCHIELPLIDKQLWDQVLNGMIYSDVR